MKMMLCVLVAVLLPGAAQAKRAPAPKVEPVVYQGVRYTAPNDQGRRGYIQAWDNQTQKRLWEVTVFQNKINPALEEDVQWVFIRRIEVKEGQLRVFSERGQVYSVDLKTRAVKPMKPAPPAKPQTRAFPPNISGRATAASKWRPGGVPPTSTPLAC